MDNGRNLHKIPPLSVSSFGIFNNANHTSFKFGDAPPHPFRHWLLPCQLPLVIRSQMAIIRLKAHFQSTNHMGLKNKISSPATWPLMGFKNVIVESRKYHRLTRQALYRLEDKFPWDS